MNNLLVLNGQCHILSFSKISYFNIAGIWPPGMMDHFVTWDYTPPHSRRPSKSKFQAFLDDGGEGEEGDYNGQLSGFPFCTVSVIMLKVQILQA